MNTQLGSAADRPDPSDPHVKHSREFVQQRLKLLRHKTLLSLHCPEWETGLTPKMLADGEIIRGSLQGKLPGTPGEEVNLPFVLSAPVEYTGKKLRLSLNGPQLPGTPLGLLLAKEFSFFKGDAARGTLLVEDESTVQLPDRNQGPAENLAQENVLIGDGGGLAADGGRLSLWPVAPPDRSHLPQGSSDQVRWWYDSDAPTGPLFRIEAIERDGLSCAPVLISLAAADDPTTLEQRVQVLHRLPGAPSLVANLSDLEPEALGAEVNISVEPIRPEVPEHVNKLLAKVKFVALPITVEEEGSFLVDFRWGYQHAAAATKGMGWVLQLSTEGEAN